MSTSISLQGDEAKHVLITDLKDETNLKSRKMPFSQRTCHMQDIESESQNYTFMQHSCDILKMQCSSTLESWTEYILKSWKLQRAKNPMRRHQINAFENMKAPRSKPRSPWDICWLCQLCSLGHIRKSDDRSPCPPKVRHRQNSSCFKLRSHITQP